MVNKDFLKAVLCGEKRLAKLNEVKFVNTPHFDEISVSRMWPNMSQDAEFMKFMPCRLPKGRNVDRAYFFNIYNTLYKERL